MPHTTKLHAPLDAQRAPFVGAWQTSNFAQTSQTRVAKLSNCFEASFSRLPLEPAYACTGSSGGSLAQTTYLLTAEGIRVAVFYSKLRNRLLCPLLAANQPPAPLDVRRALATLERSVNQYTLNARLGAAAA